MWYSDTQSRILDWKKFRESLDSMSESDAVHATNNFYHTAPISPRYYHCDFPEEWPDPWQLIVDNCYDDIARALGMLYTLYYSKHKLQGEIRCYTDTEQCQEHNLAWLCHVKYILNYDLLVVVNTSIKLKAENLKARVTLEDLVGNESNSSNKKEWS
jgi:hypothetical protein